MKLISRLAVIAAIAIASLLTAPVARAQLLLKSGGTGAQNNLLIQLVSTSNHIDPVTGITPTVTIRKANGGTTFATPAGAVTEVGNGWYQVAANAADTSAVGELIVHATGTGADVADRTYYVVAYDPTDAANLGLTTPATLLARIPGTVQPQTGDAFLRLGAPTGGVSISADLATKPTASAVAAAVAAIMIDSGVTLQDATLLIQAALTGKYSVGTFNTTAHTQVTTYYKADGTTALCTSTVTYASNNTTVLGRTTVWSNLP